MSRTFPGLQIGALPSLAVTPGAILSSLLKATVNLATNHQAVLTGSPWDTPEVRSALSNQVDAVTGLIRQVQLLRANPKGVGSYN
ncbi:MAG: hypothetical protein HY735_33295 [Verrucomicrobia bacterium]|nr:hypothetical protein [Verrucomicrobiota bacterium]